MTEPFSLLLVEEAEHDRAIFRRIVERSEAEWDIEEQSSGEEALTRLTDKPSGHDLVVLDHRLPGMSGLQVFHRMRERGIDVPVVLLVDRGGEEIAAEALDAGVDDFLLKDPAHAFRRLLPALLPVVVRRHRERLERRRAEEELRRTLAAVERRVEERTADLATYNAELAAEIEERARTERALRELQGRLSDLASRLAVAAEAERQELAVQLHDSVAQLLVSALFRLDALKSGGGPEELIQGIEDVRDVIAESLERTRTMTFELCPPALYREGLTSATEWLVGHFQESHDLEVRLSARGDLAGMSDEKKAFLYRAVRELLNNVVRHARAANAVINLSSRGGWVRIEVQDTGRGMQDGEWERSEGFGLLSLRAHAERIGGSLEVRSQPDWGTRVTVRVPRVDASAGGGRQGTHPGR